MKQSVIPQNLQRADIIMESRQKRVAQWVDSSGRVLCTPSPEELDSDDDDFIHKPKKAKLRPLKMHLRSPSPAERWTGGLKENSTESDDNSDEEECYEEADEDAEEEEEEEDEEDEEEEEMDDIEDPDIQPGDGGFPGDTCKHGKPRIVQVTFLCLEHIYWRE